MFDILHIILMGLLNLVIGLFIGILIGSWDFDKKQKKKSNNNQKIFENQNLTTSEEMVYVAIKQYFKKYKSSPTYREISKMIGCSSPGTIGNIIKSLKRKGYIDYKQHTSRTIKIIKK